LKIGEDQFIFVNDADQFGKVFVFFVEFGKKLDIPNNDGVRKPGFKVLVFIFYRPKAVDHHGAKIKDKAKAEAKAEEEAEAKAKAKAEAKAKAKAKAKEAA
jgi:hypothetical protein